MNDEFKPLISERTTTELLEIVGDYKKWNPDGSDMLRFDTRFDSADLQSVPIMIFKIIPTKQFLNRFLNPHSF
ncbi:hypothetical protein MCEGE10_02964 [Flavobacteriaceae bacterium]